LLAETANAAASPLVTAREEAIAPMPVAAAAPRNNKQKIRRHLDGVNVDVGFGFVIIGLPLRLKYLG
jgi:hypothetical protein